MSPSASLSLLLLLLAPSLTAAPVPSTPAVQRDAEAVAPLRPSRLAAPVPLPSPEAYARASAGEIVTGLAPGGPGEPHRAWAVAVLEVSADALWAAVNDELGFAREAWGGVGWVVDGRACADGRASLVTMPIPVVADRWWVVRYRHNPGLELRSDGGVRELSWVEEPGAERWIGTAQQPELEGARQVTISRGAWLLVALDSGHTLVEYQLQSDAGGSLPASAAAVFCAAAIENTLRAMEARARRGAPGCTPARPTALEAS